VKPRIVRLLDDPVVLTPRQLAQKRYQESAKGKAAAMRYYEKKRQDPAYKARARARAKRWAQDNPARKRVYQRVWQQTDTRLKRAA
jgi:hypothetical protein